MSKKTLICIRHGETTGDLEDRYGGWYDDVLSPAGHTQCATLADEMTAFDIKKVFCSSLTRAQETARYLAKSRNIPVQPLDELRERNQYGILTGMVKSEAGQKFSGHVAALKDYRNTIEGAESYDTYRQRTVEAVTQLMNDDADCMVVVWHSGGMRVMFRDIMKLGELDKVGDCAWVELTHDESGWKFGRMQRMAQSKAEAA